MALTAGTNSYATRAEADTYFDDSLRKAEWNAFTNANKDAGLIEATRMMERQEYVFEKVNTLAFPMKDATDCSGTALSEAETLAQGKDAQFELAIAILKKPALLSTASSGKSNRKSVKAGSVKIDFFVQESGNRFPDPVTEILKCFLVSIAALGGKKRLIGTSVVTGNCDKTQFDSGLFNIRGGFD